MEGNSGRLTGKERKFSMLICMVDVSHYVIKPDGDAGNSKEAVEHTFLHPLPTPECHLHSNSMDIVL